MLASWWHQIKRKLLQKVWKTILKKRELLKGQGTKAITMILGGVKRVCSF